jgi:ABC-type sugar transport system ATPase subunit
VAFIGATGAGKSTTINFCCGAEMVMVKASDDVYDERIQIEVSNQQRANFLVIGHIKSTTKTIDLRQGPNAESLYFCGEPQSAAIVFIINPFNSSFEPVRLKINSRLVPLR